MCGYTLQRVESKGTTFSSVLTYAVLSICFKSSDSFPEHSTTVGKKVFNGRLNLNVYFYFIWSRALNRLITLSTTAQAKYHNEINKWNIAPE